MLTTFLLLTCMLTRHTFLAVLLTISKKLDTYNHFFQRANININTSPIFADFRPALDKGGNSENLCNGRRGMTVCTYVH